MYQISKRASHCLSDAPWKRVSNISVVVALVDRGPCLINRSDNDMYLCAAAIIHRPLDMVSTTSMLMSIARYNGRNLTSMGNGKCRYY